MTREELQNTYNQLTKLAEDLRVKAEAQDADGVQRTLAGLGSVLLLMSRIVAESKTQLDEITTYERNRERISTSLRDERALRFFAAMKSEDREHLVQSVENTLPNISIKEFAEQIAKDTKFSSWSVTELLQCVGSWYSYLSQNETEDRVNAVASFLIEAYDAEESTKQMLQSIGASDSSSPFMQQFKRLLRCHGTLGVTSKAEMLSTRNERQFGYATVSTDIRPIFGGNVQTVPVYGVVVHELILGITERGTSRTFGIALTPNDILNFGDVLNRAWKKEETLRQHNAYKLLPLKKNA
jgi:hypothetical protein